MHATIIGHMTDAAAATSFEKANTAYEEGQKAFKENPTLENSLKNYNDIKNRNKMDAVRGAKGNHGYTNPSKDYSAGTVSTGFIGGQAVMPGAYKPPKFASDGEGFTQEQIDAKKKMEEKQKSVAKPKSKIDMGKIAVGANTALSALSGLTGFAAKMGDASRKLVQTALNPSPTGLNEMKGFADTTQQIGDATKAGVKGISDTQKQFKDNQKLLKERDDFRDYNELEKIREKYVDMMDKAPNDSNWGDIAEQYQNEVMKYFTDAGRDISKLDPNSVQAKQIKRVARELTNMGQRKKSQVGLENARKVQDAKEKKFEAKTKLDDEKSILRDINLHDKTQIADMLKTGKDRNNNDLSDDDKLTLDLLLNINDLDTAAEMSAGGEGISPKVFKRLAKEAEDRAFKTIDPAMRQRLEKASDNYWFKANEAQLAHDEREYRRYESIYNNPKIPLVEKLRTMNKGKNRGYELNDVQKFEEVGFVPNKNLIKDARFILDKNEAAAKALDENSPMRQFALKQVEYERAKLTPAFMLADIHNNVFEKLERTVPGKEIEMVPRYIRGKEGQDMTGAQWFDAIEANPDIIELTDENAKAAIYSAVYEDAMLANARLNDAWDKYREEFEKDPKNAKFLGMNTPVLNKNGQVQKDRFGNTVTIGSELAREVTDHLNNYDRSLNLLHERGSKVPANMKEIMKGIGFVVNDYVNNGGAGAHVLVPPGAAPGGSSPKGFVDFDTITLTSASGQPLDPNHILDKDDLGFISEVNKMADPADRTQMIVAKALRGLNGSDVFQKATAGADMTLLTKAVNEYLNTGKLSSDSKDMLIRLFNAVEAYDNAFGGRIVSSLPQASRHAMRHIYSLIKNM